VRAHHHDYRQSHKNKDTKSYKGSRKPKPIAGRPKEQRRGAARNAAQRVERSKGSCLTIRSNEICDRTIEDRRGSIERDAEQWHQRKRDPFFTLQVKRSSATLARSGCVGFLGMRTKTVSAGQAVVYLASQVRKLWLLVQRSGAIGYVEYTYVLQNKMIFGLVQNQAGRFVKPGAESFQAAASSADWSNSKDFYLIMTDAPGEGAYPITAADKFGYALVSAPADAVGTDAERPLHRNAFAHDSLPRGAHLGKIVHPVERRAGAVGAINDCDTDMGQRNIGVELLDRGIIPVRHLAKIHICEQRPRKVELTRLDALEINVKARTDMIELTPLCGSSRAG
jgi:hypothetical protein